MLKDIGNDIYCIIYGRFIGVVSLFLYLPLYRNIILIAK